MKWNKINWKKGRYFRSTLVSPFCVSLEISMDYTFRFLFYKNAKYEKKKNNEKTGEKKNKLKRRKKKKEKKKPILDFFLLFVFLIPSNLNRLIAYDTAPCVKIEKAMKLKEKKKTRKRRRKKNYDKIQFLRPHSFFLSYLL